MAMKKDIQVGDLLFTFQTAHYSEREHQFGRLKYQLAFKTLHVHNRRERTTGCNVPREFIPILDKLGIRYDIGHADTVIAIGCRSMTYYSVRSDVPYPTVEVVNEAKQALAFALENGSASYEGTRIKKTPFMENFTQQKVTNQDSLFALQKPFDYYLSNQTYQEA